MRTTTGFLLSLLLLALAACAPSSADVKRARAAEYDPREYATIFETAKATMIESGYDIAGEDIEQGIIVSTWRWYSPEGMAKRKEVPRVENGSAMFRIAVQLAKGPNGGIIVKVDGDAQGYRTGSPVAYAFKHDDPEEPTWVEGKIDNLAVGIFKKLSKLTISAPVPGAAPAAPAAAPASEPAPTLPATAPPPSAAN